MKISAICVLWALLVFLMQGKAQQQCKRTNTKPYRYCIGDKVCSKDKDCKKNEKCLCDGDCGMSCIKNDLKCRALRKPKNAKVLTTGFGFQDTVTYACKNGYTMRGTKKRTCRGIGTWDGKKTRCPRLCKDPGDIKFGNKQEDRRYYKVGSKITYWCFPNYEQEGNNKLICTKAGTWSSPPPKCNLPTCLKPTTPANARTRKGLKERYRFNEIIVYDFPTCLKPTTPANARTRKRLKERYRFNEIIVYDCEYGHFTTGYRVRRCTVGGKWSELKLRCIPKSCGDPGTPKNGRRNGYLFTFKKKVHYECDRGYILIGPQFRQCQSNQKWSDDTPTCEPVDCGRLPTPQHGEKIGETKSTYLGEVSFRCNKKGYQLKGSSRRVCQENGKWDGTLTKCEPYKDGIKNVT
ncbi:CUB and sushi domain-containing protein 3 [Exaiptasia diaphana]|nr:CUB and sushi domain-containing protein 3 [Exaiptasia diaphana]